MTASEIRIIDLDQYGQGVCNDFWSMTQVRELPTTSGP